MAQTYFSVTTKRGRALEASSKAEGTAINFSHMAVGDGGGSTPTPSTEREALINEKWRGEINDLYIDPDNPDTWIAEIIVPETVGGFTVREVGLFTTEGILYQYGNAPDTVKPVLSEGSSKSLYLRMPITVSSEVSVILYIDPAKVTATRSYVDREISKIELTVTELREDMTELREDMTELREDMEVVLSKFRIPLTSDTTFYVRTNGNDANDGRTAATALKTLAGARLLLEKYDPRSYTVTIDVGPGTFQPTGWEMWLNPLYTVRNTRVIGAGVGATTIGPDDTWWDVLYSHVAFTGNIRSVRNGTVQLHGPVRFIGCGLYATTWSSVDIQGANIEFYPGAAPYTAISAHQGGCVFSASGTTITAVNNPVFTHFADAVRGGTIDLYGVTFSGAATGKKWRMGRVGGISASNNDLSVFLGNQPGEIDNNGAFLSANGIARAAGNVSYLGLLNLGFGIKSVTKTAVGTYVIGTDIYQGYPVAIPLGGASKLDITCAIDATTGKTYTFYTSNVAGTLIDASFSLAIF